VTTTDQYNLILIFTLRVHLIDSEGIPISTEPFVIQQKDSVAAFVAATEKVLKEQVERSDNDQKKFIVVDRRALAPRSINIESSKPVEEDFITTQQPVYERPQNQIHIHSTPEPQFVAPQQRYTPQPQYVAPQQHYVPQPQYVAAQQHHVPQPQYVAPQQLQQQYVAPQQHYVPQPQYMAPQQHYVPQPQYMAPQQLSSAYADAPPAYTP
jgi:hypothetical protein